MKRTVLVVDDEENMQLLMRMLLEDAGYNVLAADNANAALAHLANPNLDVVLSDLKMPGMSGEELVARCRQERPDVPVIVVTAHGTIQSAVNCIREGAANYLTKPFQPEELEIAVHNALRLSDAWRENERLKASVSSALGTRRLIGDSPAAQHLHEEIRRVAPYRTNVLVTGESGTGKELVARSIHELGPRASQPWVALNCSAIPRDLMESELFGYVKGAFTGAAQGRPGRLEQAQGGTLFLDEIGDLDLGLQAKLLRVLQEREFSPVGSDQVRTADIRFIAATNRDLKELVREGRFREDLLYRIDVYNIVVPPLRARREDIPVLATTFLRELTAEMDKPVHGFAPEALAVLDRYEWPGNVRELRNAVERAVLTCRHSQIGPADLPQAITAEAGRGRTAELPAASRDDRGLDQWLEEVEREAIIVALKQCNGVQAHAAKRLGISERSLWHRVKKLGIQISKVMA